MGRKKNSAAYKASLLRNHYKTNVGSRKKLKKVLVSITVGGHKFYNDTDNTWDKLPAARTVRRNYKQAAKVAQLYNH